MKRNLRKFFTVILLLCVFVFTPPYLVTSQQTTTNSYTNNVNTANAGVSISADSHWLVVNDTDDNNNEQWDFEEEPVVSELHTLKLTVSGTAGDTPVTVLISAISGGAKIDGFWQGIRTEGISVSGSEVDGKEKRSSKINSFYVPANSTVVQTVYIEGVHHSDTLNDVVIEAKISNSSGKEVSDKEELTVYHLDMDVDSFNDNGFDAIGYTDAEDKIENSSAQDPDVGGKRPGKFIGANDTNMDGDMYPDFADGFNIKGGKSKQISTTEECKFVPFIVKLKEPLNPEYAHVTINYGSESKPEEGPLKVISSGNEHGFEINTGGLRVWKKNKNDERNKEQAPQGDFVSSNVKYKWTDLAQSASDREVTLYVEYVDTPAYENAGQRAISAKVEENDVVVTDEVKILPFHLEMPSCSITMDGNTLMHQNELNEQTEFRPEVEFSILSGVVSKNNGLHTCDLFISGKVFDALNTVVDTPDPNVSNITIFVNGEAKQTITTNPGGDFIRPWMKRGYTGNFSTKLSVDITHSGLYHVKVVTGTNRYGRSGWDVGVFNINMVQETNPPPSLPIMPAFSLAFEGEKLPNGDHPLLKVIPLDANGIPTNQVAFGNGAPSHYIFTRTEDDDSLAYSGEISDALGNRKMLSVSFPTWKSKLQMASNLDFHLVRFVEVVEDDAQITTSPYLAKFTLPDASYAMTLTEWLLHTDTVVFGEVAANVDGDVTYQYGGSQKSVARSPRTVLRSHVIRMKGLPEDHLHEKGTQVTVNGVIYPLVARSFSPEFQYIASRNDGNQLKIFCISGTDKPPSELDIDLRAGEDGEMETVVTWKGTVLDNAKAFSQFEWKGNWNDENQYKDNLTVQQLITWFRLLYGEEGERMLGWFYESDGVIVLENELGELDVNHHHSTINAATPTVTIIIEKKLDPMTAAQYLAKGLEIASGKPPMQMVISNAFLDQDEANQAISAFVTARQQMAQHIAEFAADMTDVYMLAASIQVAPVGITIEAVDALHAGADVILKGRFSSLINFIPYANRVGGKALKIASKNADNVIENTIELTAAQVKHADELMVSVKQFEEILTEQGLNKWAKDVGYKSARGFDAKMGGTAAAVAANKISRETIERLLQLNYYHVTDKQCRTILKKNLGPRQAHMVENGMPWEAHHFLPVQFKEYFIKAGVNFNDKAFGQYIPKSVHGIWHKGANGGEYNELWENFFFQNPQATKDQILTEVTRLRNIYVFP